MIISIIIFIIIYTGVLYNIYIHPTEIINSFNVKEIIIFWDFKYLFKIINCHHQGVNVYSPNDCYSDYYGGIFVYGPLPLILPNFSQKISEFLIYPISTILILAFIYLNIKIIKPDNLAKYLLISLIFLNPITFLLYEKLNIDILIYISLVILVYLTKKDYIKFLLIFCLTLIKFYPAIFSIIFLLQKKKFHKNILYFFIFIISLLIFIYLFKENLKNILNTLEYASQSFKYSFSLNSLSKIFSFLFELKSYNLVKFLLITLNLFCSFFIYVFFLKKKINLSIEKINSKNFNMFILSSSLSISLYLIFGNNFYREVYLIGTIPFILNNYEIRFFKNLLHLYVMKYVYLLIFFPYYYNSNLNNNILAQVLVGLKSVIDYFFVCLLLSVLFLVIKTYYNKYLYKTEMPS